LFDRVCLLALGKLGGKEITVGSDLDIIFLYNKERISAQDAEKVAKSILGFYEQYGLKEIDVRLRPEGKNSPLAIELGYYRDYLRDRASLWERQSLVKARVLWGDEEITAEVAAIIEEGAYGRPLEKGWTDELREMRGRMAAERSRNQEFTNLKTGHGGLVDLEFSLQALQLRFGRQHPAIRSQNSFHLLQELNTVRFVDRALLRAIERNLVFLRTLETFVRLNSESTSFVLPADSVRLQALAAAMGKTSGPLLLRQLATLSQQNREIFDRALELCDR
jgi:glutamate-ammonia-ligase adenylyltransferase